jgi:predicted dehydrogenase
LAWAADFQEDHLVEIKKMYPNVQVTQDYRELLKSDIDAVDIATPVSVHHSLAMEALRAGHGGEVVQLTDY